MRTVDMDTMETMKMECEFRMLFDGMEALHDGDDDERVGGQR